jgi:hypothetical protein
VVQDYAGWEQSLPRLTCMTEGCKGATLLRHRWMSVARWEPKLKAFREAHPGPIRQENEPGPVTTEPQPFAEYPIWQQVALKYLRAGAVDRLSRADIKQFEVEPMGDRGALLVRVEVGSVGDEGTPATLLRYRGLFRIGPRGGIRALNPRKGVKARARRHPVVFGFSTFGDRT